MLLATSTALLFLAATACSGGGRQQSTGGDGTSYTIAMITHEQPGTAFWDRVRAGATQAAKQHNITLKYSNDPDQARQAVLVQNAIDSKVDGIAATLAFPNAVGPAVAKANQAGIPTVAWPSRAPASGSPKPAAARPCASCTPKGSSRSRLAAPA